MGSVEILGDWHFLRISLACLAGKLRIAVKNRIKLPSSRSVETFAVSFFPPFLLFSFSSIAPLFSRFHPRDPVYLFYPPDSRSTLSRVVGLLPLFFCATSHSLLFLLFSVLFCFSRFANVCEAPIHRKLSIFLSLTKL